MIKNSMLKAVLISTTLIISSCNNKTDEICDCLKKAANTYMVKGEMAKENDLMKMCSQFEGALKGADVDDKRVVETCLDSVKKHIEDKILFTDIEKVTLPVLPCGQDLIKELVAIKEDKITKKGEQKAMNYYLKNRELTCTIVVNDIVWDYAADKPKVYDGMLSVTGFLYDKNEIIETTIELLIPEKEFNNIKKAVSAIKVMNNPEYPSLPTYSQLIKFTATSCDNYKSTYWMFKSTSFEFLSPNSNTETAKFKGQPRFIFSSNSSSTAEEKNTNATETSIMYYKVQDPDGYANLRSQPKGDVIKKVYDSEKFEIVSTEGDFKKIKLSDGTIGYIHSSRVVAVK